MLLMATTPLYAQRQKSQKTPVTTQAQKDLARFYVTKAIMNGRDVTAQIAGNKVYTVFYETSDGALHMANVWEKQKSQSWGPILNMKSKQYPQTERSYKVDLFTFDWAFSNSYDSKRGVCQVTFTKTYKPEGVISTLTMRQESGEVTEYIGYMEGSVNFHKYRY